MRGISTWMIQTEGVDRKAKSLEQTKNLKTQDVGRFVITLDIIWDSDSRRTGSMGGVLLVNW
jgi:hypothetical protein